MVDQNTNYVPGSALFILRGVNLAALGKETKCEVEKDWVVQDDIGHYAALVAMNLKRGSERWRAEMLYSTQPGQKYVDPFQCYLQRVGYDEIIWLERKGDMVKANCKLTSEYEFGIVLPLKQGPIPMARMLRTSLNFLKEVSGDA